MKQSVVLMILAAARLAAAATIAEQIEQTSSMVGQLINVPVPGYYASAIVYSADDERLLLVTNDHAIPRSQALRRELEFKGPVTRWKRVRVKVLGRAPGYDVALLSIPRLDTVVPDAKKLPGATLVRNTQSHFYPTIADDPPGRGSRMAILGVPRFWQGYDGISVRNRTWAQEAELAAARPIGPLGETKPQPAIALSEPVRLTLRRDCPPPFLAECHEIPIASWGYSGGALIVATAQQEKYRSIPIYGLISHFSPLSESTYVIPMPVVKRIAERLLLGSILRGGAEYVETVDEERHYEILDDGRIKILFGPLRDRIVARVDSAAKQGGAGESRGGGAGESRGGGAGESRGGGGAIDFHPCPTCYWILPVETGLTHFLGAYSLLRDSASKPENWGKPGDPFTAFASVITQAKGADALFAFRPGAEVSERTYHYWGGKMIANRKDFLLAYAANPYAEGHSLFLPWPLPSRLTTRAGWANSGLELRSSARRWRPIEAIKTAFARGEKSTIGFLKEDIEETIADYDDPQGKDEERWADLATHLEQASISAVIREATLRPGDKLTWLELTRSDGSRAEILLDGPWEAKGGQLYQQRGRNHFASLQRDREKGIYELKLVMTAIPPASEVKRDPYFTEDEIRIRSIYLKLAN